jgi:tagatose 1,6-diphosphate aldolase GatY/KbaY
MKLVTSKEIFRKAQEGRYAIGAFNIHNLETLQAVLDGASELNSPVIIQTTPGTVEWAGIDYLIAILRTAARANNIPIVLHLDHARDFGLIEKAIKQGYTSVMIDGSHLSYQENLEITQKVVRLAHRYDVVVEAELGKIGGREENIVGGEDDFTDPEVAVDFVEKTGIDSLAVAIGTAHGLYQGETKLDFERLEEIRKRVEIPLVLHGASDIPDEKVKKAIKLGISKVNISTELKIAFTTAIKEFLTVSEENDPRKYLEPGKKAITELVKKKINVFRSACVDHKNS